MCSVVYTTLYSIVHTLIVVLCCVVFTWCIFCFFQAEDGIRDLVRSRGLGDVYKRQDDALAKDLAEILTTALPQEEAALQAMVNVSQTIRAVQGLSLIHI